MNEDELCKKRLLDLSKQANRKGIVLFSDFLNLNELNIYHQCERLLETGTQAFGGVDFAERQIIAFIPDALYYEWHYPIRIIKITPSHPKFAEKLGHRDILGAVMNLGMDRSKIGDIFIAKDEYFMICEENAADYFLMHLDKIKHTAVKTEYMEGNLVDLKPEFTVKDDIVASNRIDSIIACVYKLSRTQAAELIQSEKVYINGRVASNSAYRCKQDEVISVRGFGRFEFVSENGTTNKGRLKIRYRLYGI